MSQNVSGGGEKTETVPRGNWTSRRSGMKAMSGPCYHANSAMPDGHPIY